eukprot:TRINITY_DN561_c1_g1_i1.p1 TRINITY_DN561_c1_g1~~TRINITY_DN561_c1_g1_i1.p1  ORF type:complete len:423 (-),score=210.81 TRINITY_DN561_c1_g1_i1:161-1429(-)
MLIRNYSKVARSFCLNKSINRSFTTGFWSNIIKGPEDPILGVTVAFNKDTNPKKVNLGVGAYRDDNGKPFVLNCIRKAEELIANSDHEYVPINGLASFNSAAQKLTFGENSTAISEKRIVTVQTLSGTGALRVAGSFLQRFTPATVYLPDPSWANHKPIFNDSGLSIGTYSYYNPANCGLNFKEMTESIAKLPANSIVLLHACAHNPTGVDPTHEQWVTISQLVKEKNLIPLIDLAYQGFASGDPEYDVFAVRQFLKDGHKFIVCQSFAKNFGLYGERIGALHVVASNEDEAVAIESQLKILIRPMYSNPPVTGARLVSTVLNDAQLTTTWRSEVRSMASRIITMRESLVEGLRVHGSKRDWRHITDQIGMFCYSGLTPEQVDALARDHSIYMTRNGRISIAGVTTKNIDHLAKSMCSVTKN